MLKHALLLAALPAALAAQQAPAIRLINAPSASTKPTLGLAAAVRQLPNGGLLVNDIMKRQLVLFDPTLANATIVADSVSGGANSYGTRPGGIIPYVGDSTLFVDPAGLSMFVLDPNGAIARVASVPRSQDAGAIGNNMTGSPALDAKGRIVYRAMAGMRMMMGPPPANGAARTGPGMTMADPPDTAAIVRIDPVSRKLDTAGFYKIPKTKMNMVQSDKGMSITMEMNPLPLVDDWAVLSDGSLAILRGRDYHVDWINPDGTLTVSPKLPFDWQRLSDDDKIAVIDSAKAMAAKGVAAMGPDGAGGRGGPPGAGGERGMVVMSFGGGDGGGRGNTSFGGGPGGASPLQFVSPSELPDYRPAFMQNSLKADVDGNLWIRTTATRPGSVGGGPVYDVVDRKGEVVDRLQVPAGRTIVGFGKGGVVYMLARDDKGSWIERTKR
jgi:hypothetical protein